MPGISSYSGTLTGRQTEESPEAPALATLAYTVEKQPGYLRSSFALDMHGYIYTLKFKTEHTP